MTGNPENNAGQRDPEMHELEAEFGSIMGLLRDGPHDVEPVEPSADLWSKIELDLTAGSQATSASEAPVAPAVTPADASATTEAAAESSNVVSLADARASRGKRAAIFTAVAAAVALVAVPVGLSLRSDSSNDILLAAGELDVLDNAASESAVVELYDTDGNLWLDLDTSRAAGDGEFLELWLIEADENGEVADLISLGQIDGSGAYDIPDDVDLDRFSVVDISVEPDDGNPEHSGDSIHRGIPTS